MSPGRREGNPTGVRGLAAIGARRPGWTDPALLLGHEGAPRQVRRSVVHTAPLPLR